MQSLRQDLKLQMTILCISVRLRNVSIYRKLQKQIFQSQLHFTKYTSKNTSKTLDFLSDVRKVKYKERNSTENRRLHEAIEVRMDMSHMRMEVPLLLIGDPVYPLLEWLMKPFQDSGCLSREHHLFNYGLSRARIVMENTFGHL